MCSSPTPKLTHILLAFLTSFNSGNPNAFILNFANLGYYDSSNPSSAFGLANIVDDIKFCQSQGVKMILSIGGSWGSNSDYFIGSGQGATLAAVWDALFFNSGNTNSPLYGVVLDGIDFDIETNFGNEVGNMISYFRGKHPNKEQFIITGKIFIYLLRNR
jgi:chitinase